MSASRFDDLMAFANRCFGWRLEAREALDVAAEMFRLAEAYADGDAGPRLGLARCHEAAFRFEEAFQVYLDRKGTRGPGFSGDTGIERHLDNFLDSIRTGRQPNADARIAHLTCALVHLGEIAQRVQRLLQFDPKTETITGLSA